MAIPDFLPFAMALLANSILGASSVYWHLFRGLSPVVLVSYRVVFSLILLGLLAGFLASTGKSTLNRLTPRIAALHAAAAVLVAINWGTFIWASLHGTVLESGLGYLLAPVIVMISGQLWHTEPASVQKRTGIAIILLCLFYLIFASGQLAHWVYWTIGLTWGVYTLLKKQTPLSSVDGLFIETSVLMLFLMVALSCGALGSHHMTGAQLSANPWLWAAGLVSVTPLIMFAFAARRLNSFRMGALQFMLPTTQLFISYAWYGQSAAQTTYICFAIIWLVIMAITISA